MTGGVLALVDSPEAAAVARKDDPTCLLATENPSLAARRDAIGPMIDLDRLLPGPAAERLGRAACAAVRQVAKSADRHAIATRYGLLADGLMLYHPQAVCPWIYRAAVLAAALARYEPRSLMLRLVETDRWHPFSPLRPTRFSSPARALAEQGFFGDLPVDIKSVAQALPTVVNETAIRSLPRRLAMLPLASIVFEFADRIIPWRDRSRRLGVMHENETMREALPWLALAGIGLQRGVDFPETQPCLPNDFAQPAEYDPELQHSLRQALSGQGAITDHLSPAQLDAVASTIAIHLTAYLQDTARRLPGLKTWLAELFPERGGGLLVNGANGLTSLLMEQVFALCRAQGVKILECEHGLSAGFSEVNNGFVRDGGHPLSMDLLACSSESAVTAYAGGENGGRTRIAAVGLPDQMCRPPRKWLQRLLARSALNLDTRTPVVMHVSTAPYYVNFRTSWGLPSEHETFDFRQSLLTDVYPRVPAQVLYKDYPTRRFPYEPTADQQYDLPGNIRLLPDADFRYVRFAADVIVISGVTSTFGWCVGVDVPLVWLHSEAYTPLRPGLRAQFAAAFLFVDLDKPDWPERLRDLLSAPLADLQASWRDRKAARKALLSELAGPVGSSGRRAAREILCSLSEVSA